MALYKNLTREEQAHVDGLGLKLEGEFNENEKLREEKELEWVQSLRQCKGQYDPETLAKLETNASRVYVKYTRYKEFTLRAILNNILFSDNDKNWQIKPTPKPILKEETVNGIIQSIRLAKYQELMQSEEVVGGESQPTEDEIKQYTEPTQEEVEKAVSQYAGATCNEMETEIEDQLLSMKYLKTQKEVLKSGVRFGTGVIEGSFSETSRYGSYEMTNEGIKQVIRTKKMPTGDLLRLWDWYPDMSALELCDADFAWKRIIVSKHQLRELANRPDFYSDKIHAFIRAHPGGNAKYKQWELYLEQIANKKTMQHVRRNKYELLSRWGYIDGETLHNAGFEIAEEDMNTEFMCNIYILGNYVIKFTPNPSPRTIRDLTDIYHVFYFEKDETSIFGTGLPKISRDMELTMGGAMRTAINNAALIGGFQAEVNLDLLYDDEDPEEIRPYRIWKRGGRGIDAQYQAVRPIEFPSHVPDMISLFDKALMVADLELSMPMWMHTEPEKTTKQNIGQVSAKWQVHTVSIKDIVGSFDECNGSFLKAIYNWNMEYNPNDALKGDYEVKAKGSTALLMKELKMQAFSYFTQTLSDEERLYIKTDKLLKERMKLFIESKVDEYIRSEEEVSEIKAQNIDQEQLELMKEKIKAEIVYDLAKAEHMKAKAASEARGSNLEIIEKLTALGEEKTSPGAGGGAE